VLIRRLWASASCAKKPSPAAAPPPRASASGSQALEYLRLASADDALLRADDAFAAAASGPPMAVGGEPPATLRAAPAPWEREQAGCRGREEGHGNDDHGREHLGRRRVPVAAAASGGRDLRRDTSAEWLRPVGIDEVRRGARAERGQPGAAQVSVVPVLEAGLPPGRQFPDEATRKSIIADAPLWRSGNSR